MPESAYDKHWARLAELLGADEAAAERARMTRDERDDLRRKKIESFRRELPWLRTRLELATVRGRGADAARLRRKIAYRERVVAKEEES
jgi:hypothetical protein